MQFFINVHFKKSKVLLPQTQATFEDFDHHAYTLYDTYSQRFTLFTFLIFRLWSDEDFSTNYIIFLRFN